MHGTTNNFSRKSNVKRQRGRSFQTYCKCCGDEGKDCRRKISTGYRHSQDTRNSILSISEELDDTESIISSECHDIDGDDGVMSIQPLQQVQEIWQNREILESLNNLPGSQEILASISTGNIEEAITHPQSAYTGLLLASYLGNYNLLTAILENDASVNFKDKEGRTPLHLSACTGSAECLEALLLAGGSPNVWDRDMMASPLHCAASAGSIQCMRLLIDAGASVQAGITSTGTGKTPLHYAVQSNSVVCVQELLQRGATANMTQVYTETPLHVAATMGFAGCLKVLLEHGADFRVQFGTCKSTPLHLAAEDGNAECARLLIEAGADLNVTNSRNQTPLHLAALAQSAKTLELLLLSKAEPNAEDVDKRTPLHCAIVKGSRSCECVQLLLQYGAKVNASDIFGYTPVHIAALNEFSSCLKLLLDHGGDVTRKTNGHVSALSFIARRTPEILPYIEHKLDQAIKLHDHEIGDVDCEIKLDFRVLVPNMLSGETGLFLTFIEVGQRSILKHPLCEIFLYLKWRRIRKFFVMSLIVHALYVVLCSTYILGVFLNSCADYQNCTVTTPYQFLNYTLLLCNFSILAKEVFQIAHIRKGYIYQWENWLQWLIIITVFITLILPTTLNPSFIVWQHHISVFGIFFNWIELMVLIGRFPMFGLYVQMFTTGAVNFGKFLLAYCCLLAAFAFSFMMLFPKYRAFQNIFNGMVKIVVMMTGELEFEEIFFGGPESVSYSGATIPESVSYPGTTVPEIISYPGTAHLFFLLFTLIVTMVLTNLLVGLSVSDIQGLQKSAGLDRLVRQAELVAYMESMLFSRLLHWIPSKILAVCHRSALLLSSTRQYNLIIRPNDPRENRIPQDLVKSAYRCVSERRSHRSRNRSHRESRYERRPRESYRTHRCEKNHQFININD